MRERSRGRDGDVGAADALASKPRAARKVRIEPRDGRERCRAQRRGPGDLRGRALNAHRLRAFTVTPHRRRRPAPTASILSIDAAGAASSASIAGAHATSSNAKETHADAPSGSRPASRAKPLTAPQ